MVMHMSDWKEVEFSKMLIDDSISYGIVQPGTHTEINSVPIIRVNNIKNGYIKTDDVLKVDSAIEDKYRRTRLNGGELLITVVGSIGECAIVPNNLKGWNVARAVSVAKIKEDYDVRFIKYSFKTDDIIFQMYGNTNDTVQPTLNLSLLKTLKFSVPSLTEQKTIASILSSFDDKIDLLNRQNSTLEKMADTLFRQWFVEEAKVEWERAKIGNVLDTVLGGTPSTTKPEYWDGNIPWINSGEVNNFRILQGTKFITALGLRKSNTKLLPKGTTVLAITGATLGQVSLLEIETCANQSVVGIIPNEILPKEFIFLWIKLKINEIILSETGGAQPHINKNDINETDIIIPDSNYLNEVKEYIEPLFKKITKNSFQIRTLTALQETLLPKLMSREVRVNITDENYAS
jgi:type I restriction enzyme, S subunit